MLFADLLQRFSRGASIRDILRWCGRYGLVSPLGAASAVSVISLSLTGRVSSPLALTTFLFVYGSYLIDHLVEVDKFGQELRSTRSQALARKKRFVALGAAALGLATLITALAANAAAVALLLLFPTAVALYGMPLLGKLTSNRIGYARLRDVPYLKSLYTSVFWGALAIFAAIFVDAGGGAQTVFFFLLITLCIFVNTVFCDFKDISRDGAEGLVTFPLKIGAERTLRLLHRLNWASLLLLVASALGGWLPAWLLGLSVTNFYVWEILDRGALPDADIDFLCNVAMDGELIVWLLGALSSLVLMSLAA
jgi:4-hydroxybenzoate polyprenyltransferase